MPSASWMDCLSNPVRLFGVICVGVDVTTTSTVFVVLWMATTSRIAFAMVAGRRLYQRAGNGGQQVQVEVEVDA